MNKTLLPEYVKYAIKIAGLHHLTSETQAFYLPLSHQRTFAVYGGGNRTVPASTMVYAFKHQRVVYEQPENGDFPKRGSQVCTTGSDWTLFFIYDGLPSVAYVTTDLHERRKVGVV